MRNKYTSFRSHTDKHNLTKDKIERPLGVQVVKSSSATENTERSSSTKAGSTASKNTSLALVKPGAGTPVTADCFFCEKPFIKSAMKELPTVIQDFGTLYACQSCFDATKSLAKPVGYDAKFGKQVNALKAEAAYAGGVVDQAVQETSWEFKMPTSLIRHVCLHNTRHYVGHDDPQFAELILSVRQAFLGNVKIIEELNELDRTHD
jgi:hypothetical protein